MRLTPKPIASAFTDGKARGYIRLRNRRKGLDVLFDGDRAAAAWPVFEFLRRIGRDFSILLRRGPSASRIGRLFDAARRPVERSSLASHDVFH
eukprot:3327461-Pleurochrysis_carterae.AAC.1